MKYLFLFPLNIILMLLLSLSLSFLNLSSFYQENTVIDFINIFIIITIYFIAYLFFKNKKILYKALNIYEVSKEHSKNKFLLPLTIGLGGFLLEFLLKGIPLFLFSGRDDYTGIPIIHPMSYSLVIVSVTYACSYSNTRKIILNFIVVLLLSIFLLSRQMFMIAVIIYLITYFIRNEISIIKFVKSFLAILFVFILFGYIGNVRQKLSGDYVEHYIYTIGGINKFGENFSDSFIWLWLYLVTPIYNLFANIRSFDSYGGSCNTTLIYGDCNGNFITSVFLPNTILKYTNTHPFVIDLVVGHLNVGTGYAVSGRLFGIFGISIQIFIQIIIFYLGYKVYKREAKFIFIILFSAFSFFMIFDNLFTKGEFFFCFIVIYIMQYRFKWN